MTKSCQRGYKKIGGVCKKIKQKVAGKLKILENGKVVRWIIFPTIMVSLIGLFIFPDIRMAMFLYLILTLFSLNAYRNKTYQEEIYGIRRGVFKRYLLGLGVGGVFLILSAIAPAFSLLTPALSLSISAQIRWAIIVILAPFSEEIWRSAVIGYIKDIYKPTSFWKVNVPQAGAFSSLHALVYGLVFSAYDKWIELYGAFTAISGSLIAAFVFGLVSGYMMEKTKGVIPSIGAHQIINWWLVTEGLVVVATLCLSLMI